MAGITTWSGRRNIVFVLVAALVLSTLVVAPFAAKASHSGSGATSRVSLTGAGAQASVPSHTPALSADGHYVAFISDAALVAGDGNGVSDVYRKNTATGVIDLVSQNSDGLAGNGASGGEEIAISDDGTKVAFRSDATNFVADTNNQTDLFVRDFSAPGVAIQRVNVDSAESVTAFGPDYFSMSADGNKIAFVSYTSLDGNPANAVYVRDVATGTTRFIHQADGAQVAISGDGSKVAFGWSSSNAYEIYLHDDNDEVLYRINYGTSSGFAEPAGLLGPDALSHDGNIAAFWSDGDTYDNIPDSADPRAVYAYDHVARKAGAFGIERLSETVEGTDGIGESGGTTNDFPKGAVSADGNKVAFTSQASNLDPNAPNGGIMVKDRTADTISARSIGTDGQAKAVANSTISANGAVVGFATAASDLVSGDTNGVSDVFVAGATQAPPTTPTPTEGGGAGSIAFTTGDGNTREIVVMNENGTGRNQLTQNAADDSFPDWSPDASRIVFESTRDGGDHDVWVMKPDGSAPTNLTAAAPGYDALAAWSPDGTTIAFVSNRGAGLNVYLMNTDGSSVRRLTTSVLGGASFGRPSWAPGSDRVLIHRGDGNLYAVDVADGSEQQLTNDAFDDKDAAWSPDGRHIAFMSNRGSVHQIYILDLETGTSRKLTTGTGFEGIPTFSADGRTVIFAAAGGLFTAPLLATPSTPVQLTTVASDARPSVAENLTLAIPSATVPAPPPSGEVLTHRPLDEFMVEGSFTGSIPASPRQVPVAHIPMNPSAPAIQTAPISSLPLLAPISSLPLLAPISSLPLLAPISSLPLLAPISSLPLLAPISSLPLLAPGSQDVLKHVPLSSLIFRDGVEALLAGTPLANRQPQDISLWEALQDPTVRQRLSEQGLDEVSLAESVLSDIGLGALLLGADTKLAAFSGTGFNFCAALNGLVDPDSSCPNDPRLSAWSPLDLQVMGVRINDARHPIPFHTFRLGQIALAPSAPIRQLVIGGLDLGQHPFGSIRVTDLPNPGAVVDCAVVDCTDPSTDTLFSAQGAGAILPAATFDDLGTTVANFTLGEVVYGLVGASVAPYEAFPPDQLGILPYEGTGTSRMRYEVRYTPVGVASLSGWTARVALPESFDVNPSSVTVFVDGVVVPGATGARQRDDAGTFLAVTGLPTVASGSVVRIGFMAYPGLELGTRTASVEVTGPGVAQAAVDRAPVLVTGNHAGNNSIGSAQVVSPDTLYVGHPGETDYYKLNVAPGSTVEVSLGNRGSGDNDLVVYYPQDVQVAQPLRAPDATPDREILPIVDNGPTLSDGGEAISSETRNDVPIADLPVAGLSDNRSRENEVVRFLALPGGDNTYTIQVSPYLDDVFEGPYTLRVRVIPPAPLLPCADRTFPHAAGTAAAPVTSVPGDTKTLFLVPWKRLERTFGTTEVQKIRNALPALLAHANVKGAVLPVDSYGPVSTALAASDTNPCSVEASNGVVRAVNDVVDSVLAASTGVDIENIVLVGSAEALPRALVPDVTQVGNEATFIQQLQLAFPGESNSLVAAGSYVPTDDPFGDFDPTPYLGRWLYSPDVAVGRLLESPTEIVKAISTFVEYDGVLQSDTAFTAGADFMKDLAELQDDVFDTRTGADQPSLTTDGWGLTDLHAALFGGDDSPGLIALNAHADQFRMEAPGSLRTPLTTAAVVSSAAEKIKGSVVFSMGCHSGLTAADVLLGSTATDAQRGRVHDWAQAVSGNGGVFSGPSGFGLGLGATVAFNEDIQRRFTENLDGTMSIGEALAFAKQSYLGEKGLLSVYDEKASTQVGLFGLPMFRVNAPVAATSAMSTASTSSTTSPATSLSGATTDTSTGLTSASLSASIPSGAFDRTTIPGLGSFDSIDGETYEAPYRPIMPKLGVDVTKPGMRAKGVAVTHLVQSADEVGFDPVLAAPALASGASEPAEPQFGNVIFPAGQTELSGYVSNDGPKDHVTLLPAQFQGTGINQAGTAVGRYRRYTTIEATVFYSDSPDVTEPLITGAEAFKVGQTVGFRLEGTDDAGIASAYVLYRDANGWHRLVLDDEGNGTYTGVASFTGADVEFSGWLIDNNGNAASSMNKGDLFDAEPIPPAPVGIQAVAAGVNAQPVNGWFRDAQVTITGGARTFRYSINGGPEVAYTGPFPVVGDGFNVVEYSASDGTEGTLVVPIDTAPPAITSVSGPLDPRAAGTSMSMTGKFTDPRVGSGNSATWEWGDGTSSTGPITASPAKAEGVVSGSHTYTTPGIYTVKLTVRDDAGGVDQEIFQYVVVYDPNGGFVTGGGWINSPLGAYTPNPELSGKATFGFVSKYKRGATTPTGTTQFRFHAGDFDFFSETYEWLVVSGARAQFKGLGAVNGTPGYGFLLTAVDGQVSGGGGTDRFRIKVWNRATGEVVYDNQMSATDDAAPTTGLGGGSITIKR